MADDLKPSIFRKKKHTVNHRVNESVCENCDNNHSKHKPKTCFGCYNYASPQTKYMRGYMAKRRKLEKMILEGNKTLKAKEKEKEGMIRGLPDQDKPLTMF